MAITVPTDAYCTLEDVQQLLPNRQYHALSKPTLSQAEQHVKEIAAVIRSALRGLEVTIPPTGDDDLLLLKMINRLGAAWLIESATMAAGQGTSQIVDNFKEEYDAMMKKLIAGEYEFEDEESTVNEADGNDDLDASGERSDPIFSISEDSRETKF